MRNPEISEMLQVWYYKIFTVLFRYYSNWVNFVYLLFRMKLILHILLVVILSVHAADTEGNVNSVKNFTKAVYKAANQNWSVDVHPNGFLYFANHKGLLEFDGVNWQLTPLPHETIMRTVLVGSDSIIYTAGYRELGYWKKNGTGHLEYISLNHLAEPYFSKNEEFWNIARLNEKIYFQSFGKILVLSEGKISPVDFPGFVNTMKRIDDKIVVAIRDMGLYYLDRDKPVPFIIDPIFMNTIVKFILPYRETEMLIGTSSKGIFTWNGTTLKQWNPEWTDYFITNEVNRAHINKNGDIIIGTILDGIAIFDNESHFIAQYNTGNGLQNNTVLGITSDRFGNIWIALDNGIGFISSDNSYPIDIQSVTDIGSVYDMAYFEGKIYLGTNQGLFYRNLNNNAVPFKLVPETQGQVWFCKQTGDHLFVGYNGGTLAIKNSEVKLISPQAGGFCMREDPMMAGNYMVSTYNNLVKIIKEGNVFRQVSLIQGFYDLIRFIEFDHRGNLWASHMHRGIYQLQLNPARDSVIQNRYFGEKSPFRKDHSVHVFKVENRIVFTTGDSLFTYDDISDSIVSYSFLNEKTGVFAKATRIVEAPGHHYWFITQKALGLFHIFNNHVELVNFIPRSLFTDNRLIDDFENVYPTGPTSAVICLENGIAAIHLDKIKPSPIVRFKPDLRSVILSGQRAPETPAQVENGVITIKSRFKNVKLRYSFPHYTHHPIYFRAMLKGIDEEWSESRTEPLFSFDRLPVGTYQLVVKAIDAWENESHEDTVTLKILPPFYLSSWAKKGYVIMSLFLFFGLQVWSIRRTRKKERLMLEKREQELIKLRNEKLRDEVEYKSKELANLTMAIIKKNEFLMSLKEIFAHQKEQLGSRYPDKYFNHITNKIDDNISNTDDWNLFETNFERAHEQFLQKLKDQFPGLTPKDLRLCAFLRMNLASKEIAPLMGISVRGVENHRYRLRKKMGLDHDDNLIEMILKL